MPVARVEDDEILFVDENKDGFDDNLQGPGAVEQPLAAGQLSNQPTEPQPQVPTPAEKQPGATATLESLLDDNKKQVYDMQERGNTAAAPLIDRANRLETSERDLDRQSNANLFAGIANSISTGLDGATSFKDRRMDNSEARKQNTQVAENVTKEQAARQAISEKLRARAEQERNRELNNRMVGANAESELNKVSQNKLEAPLELKTKSNQVKVQDNALADRDAALAKAARENSADSEESKQFREAYKLANPALANMVSNSMSKAALSQIAPMFADKYERDFKDKKLNAEAAQAKINGKDPAMRDAKSNASRNAREVFKQRYPNANLDNFENFSADDIADATKSMDSGEIYGIKSKAIEEKSRLSEERVKAAEEKAKVKLSSEDRKDLQKVSERYMKEMLPERKRSLSKVMSLLNGKNAENLAGIGLFEGTLKLHGLTPEGRELAQAIQVVVNAKLKKDSGSSVTSNELTRAMGAVGYGAWKTEAELRNGMRALLEQAQVEEATLRAGFKPEVLAVFDNSVVSERAKGSEEGSSTTSSGSGTPGSDEKVIKADDMPTLKKRG